MWRRTWVAETSGAVQIDAVVLDRAFDPCAGDGVVHAVEAPQHRALATTRWTDEGGDLVGPDLQVDLAHRLELAVVDGKIVDIEHRGGRRLLVDRLRWGGLAGLGHLVLCLLECRRGRGA